MSVKLRKLGEQVVVITGATSGIGLCTAREAARRGARVVIASRNEEELTRLAAEIEGAGGFALAVPTDVTDPRAMIRLRDAAMDKFGRIDTWVNNAGLSIYGKLHEVDLVEARRLFDVNFWGVVHGCHAAVGALRERGGAIINIGSVLSDRVIPIQGMCSASKHAVKGYTDALRMEVEMENLGISVTLIKPSAIDTPRPTSSAPNRNGSVRQITRGTDENAIMAAAAMRPSRVSHIGIATKRPVRSELRRDSTSAPKFS